MQAMGIACTLNPDIEQRTGDAQHVHVTPIPSLQPARRRSCLAALAECRHSSRSFERTVRAMQPLAGFVLTYVE